MKYGNFWRTLGRSQHFVACLYGAYTKLSNYTPRREKSPCIRRLRSERRYKRVSSRTEETPRSLRRSAFWLLVWNIVVLHRIHDGINLHTHKQRSEPLNHPSPRSTTGSRAFLVFLVILYCRCSRSSFNGLIWSSGAPLRRWNEGRGIFGFFSMQLFFFFVQRFHRRVFFSVLIDVQWYF